VSQSCSASSHLHMNYIPPPSAGPTLKTAVDRLNYQRSGACYEPFKIGDKALFLLLMK